MTNNSTHEKQFNSQYEIKPETKVSFSRLMNYMMLKRKRTFSSLPIDCWLGILGYLDESCVLASISAVSRDFHTLTLPLLYKNISWEWSSVPLSRILGLFRTVIQNPETRLLYTTCHAFIRQEESGTAQLEYCKSQ